MAKRVVVKLGEREFTLVERPMGESARWRQLLRDSQVMKIFESLEDALTQVVAIGESLTSGVKLADLDIAPVFQSVRLVPALVNGLSNSMEEVIELLFAYCPDMRKDSGWLEEHAYNDELIAAFLEVLKLNFPFMALWAMVRGSRVPSTPSNSASQNGTSGLPASGPARKKASIS